MQRPCMHPAAPNCPCTMCAALQALHILSLVRSLCTVLHAVCAALQEVYSARARLHEFVYTHPVSWD